MNKLILILTFALFTLACEEEEGLATPDITLEVSQSSYSCYDQFTQYVESLQDSDGTEFDGTACSICGENSALPGDTLIFEGYYFSDVIKLGSQTSYSKKWEIIEGTGAEIIGSDSSTSVAVVFSQNFSRVILGITNDISNLVCGTYTVIRNANIPIEIGDYGAGGGIVIYDKGFESDGWRYIEKGPYNLNRNEKIQWGCTNQPIANARNREIGDGMSNSKSIVEYHNSFIDFYNTPAECSVVSNGSVAAKYCTDFEYNGYDDWFLPSALEMSLIYKRAEEESFWLEGNQNNENLLYWTSTEHDDNTVEVLNTADGSLSYLCKSCTGVTRVLPIRYFK